MSVSIRQQRKSARADKKDKWGYPMSLSRKVRRASRRLEAGLNHYKQFPYGDQSDKHARNKPGALHYH